MVSSKRQICVKSLPDGYGEGNHLLRFLVKGWRVVMARNYFVDIIRKTPIYGTEYILEKEFNDEKLKEFDELVAKVLGDGNG